jgi:membrane protein DedA with SNARE-associated domain
MKRQRTNVLQRAYFLWTVAGTSVIVAAVAGTSVVSVLSGTADAGSFVWGIIGIAALLEALVLFAIGLRLRHRYVNTVQSYESRGDYLEDGGTDRPRIPLLGDGQARPNITNQEL